MEEIKQKYLGTYHNFLEKRKENPMKTMKEYLQSNPKFSLVKFAEDMVIPIFNLKDILLKNPVLNMNVEPVIETIFPAFNLVNDIMQVSLNNMGAIIHPTVTLLNSGSIDRDGEFYFYEEGVTKHIVNVIEKLDKERLELTKRLRVKSISLIEWIDKSYHVKADNYYDAFHGISVYREVLAPQRLRTRYITEDVPTGLVPMASLAEFLEIKTPTMSSLIHLANLTMGRNFYKTGRTLENLSVPITSVFQNSIESLYNYEENVRFT